MKLKRFMSVVTAAGSLVFFAVVLGYAYCSHAQGAGVPVYKKDAFSLEQVMEAAEKLHAAGKFVVPQTVLTNQLYTRKSCELDLAAPRKEKLASRELWAVARAAHLRVGWYYRSEQSDEWLIAPGGGYALTTNGAVATCFHGIVPPKGMIEGFLFAVDESGQGYPVTEILAGSYEADACIVRVAVDGLKPLALNTNVFPGDRCVLFSDPAGERGYFNDGVVSRFLSVRLKNGKVLESTTRLDVTIDWVPGSSGAAVLDECGNAIGHVSTVYNAGDLSSGNRNTSFRVVVHEAASAKDVLALVHKPAK